MGANPSSKTIYRTLKSLKVSQQPTQTVPDANSLNEYFTSIGPLLSSKHHQTNAKMKYNCIEKSMVLQKTDNLEVMKVIKELKNKKSSGSDDISNEIIKCCSPVVENFLAIAFNNCIEESIFPKCLKIAKVIPIYKKGDRNKPENYRPKS